MSISRRKILKTLGISAGSMLVAQLPLNGANAQSMFEPLPVFQNGKRLQAVLIGAGKRGSRYGKFSKFTETNQLSFSAVADPNTDRAAQFAQGYDVPSDNIYADGVQLLQQPRLADVAIITAGKNYVDLCKTALNAGYDVWVDKLVSLDRAEIEAVNLLAKRKGRSILICYLHDKEFCFMPHRSLTLKPSLFSSLTNEFSV